MLSTLRRAALRTLAPALLAVAAAAAHAAPVTVSLSSFGFTVGSGYGVDASEKERDGATLLDVLFAGGAAPGSVMLQAAGDSVTLNLGTVTLREASEHGGILSAEADNLGIAGSFSLLSPVNSPFLINTQGIATLGSVSDAEVDLKIQWQPVLVAFGNGGLLSILLNELSFTSGGPLVQTATIALVNALTDPAPPLGTGGGTGEGQQPGTGPAPIAAVPEPGGLMLAALALASLTALSLLRRRARSGR
jgi:hypothetical protein